MVRYIGTKGRGSYSARAFQSGSSRLQKPQRRRTSRSIGRHQDFTTEGGPHPWTCFMCCTSLSFRWKVRCSLGASQHCVLLWDERCSSSTRSPSQNTHREFSTGPLGIHTHSLCGKCTDSSCRFQSYFCSKSCVQNVHWYFREGLDGSRNIVFATFCAGSRCRFRPLRDPRLSSESILAVEEAEVES